MNENNNLLESYKISYDHHKEFMKQRNTCFNFYLIIISLVFGVLYENNNFVYQIVLTCFVCCISFCFFIIDVRTKKLLESIERLLIKYEQNNISTIIRLFSEEKKTKTEIKFWISLTWIYRAIFIIVPLFLLIAIVLNQFC